MLLFQIVALFRELNVWVVTAAIGVAVTVFELRRRAAPGKSQDSFLRDSLDW